MKNVFYTSIVLIYSFISIQAHAQDLTIQVPDTLNFIDINGNPQAYYEVILTNFYHDTIRLKKLDVLKAADSSVLFCSEGQDLLDRYGRIGAKMEGSTLLIAPGSSSIVYVELLLKDLFTTEIAHRITVDMPSATDIQIETSQTQCFLKDPLILGKPLDAGIWTAIYNPSWTRGHRRVIYIKNGKARIPGRYAIDFIKVDAGGNYAAGDENIMSNWLGHGADVLAVADGVVVAVRDNFPESETLSDHPAYPSSEMAAGNYISIKIGDGKYAFYEHLKPNSIKVKKDQKVKKGDVIASLGLTGQGTSPHLHFHVADANSPLGAEGIPFVFEEFEVLGVYSDFEDFGKRPWQPWDNSTHPTRQQERPLPNAAIKFK